MARQRYPSLRGSVTQNNTSMRMRSRETTRFGFWVRLAALTGSLALIVAIGAWLWHIGWPQREAGKLADAGLHLTQKASFAVRDVVVEGRQQTAKETLIAAVGASAGSPILAFDPAEAQARIAKLPWVESVSVERRLPDIIFVHMNERVPMARWQHNNKTVVIDADGKELPDAPIDQFTSLPLVVGAGAPTESRKFLDAVKTYPSIADKMIAAVRVGERRWDIHLSSKVVAQMPETGLEDALRTLDHYITEQKVLERDVSVIDLRVAGREIIQPGNAVPTRPTSGDMRL
jgi:cell division protein FtsQ